MVKMVKNALGLIETVGLVAAVTAADAAVKAANVELAGYELSRGGGLVVVKLFGDVGAVKAAVDAARSAASQVGTVWATHVIPRPHSELSGILLTDETVGLDKPPSAAENLPTEPIAIAEELVVDSDSEAGSESKAQDDPEAESVSDIDEHSEEEVTLAPQSSSKVASCNICLDPACDRKKGDPRVKCIHYDNNNKGES